MKQYNAELNAVAVDAALEALYGVKGRDEAKRVYELINTLMQNVHQQGCNEGALAASAELVKHREELAQHITAVNNDAKQTIQAAERVGYEKGHAAAMFAQAVEKLNADAAAVSPALALQAPQEETALVNAVSALG